MPVLWYIGDEVKSIGSWPRREDAVSAGEHFGVEGLFSRPARECGRCGLLEAVHVLEDLGVCIRCDSAEEYALDAVRDEMRHDIEDGGA